MASNSYYHTFDLNDSSCVYPFESSTNKQNFLTSFRQSFEDINIKDFNVFMHFTVCEMLKLIIADREALVQENQALATAATEMMKKVDDVHAYFTQEQEKMKGLKESNHRLFQQVEKRKADYDAAMKRVHELSEQKSKISSELAESKKYVQELRQSAEVQIIERNEENKKDIDKMKVDDEVEKIRHELNVQLDTKTNECAEIQKKLDRSREKVEKLEEKIEKLIKKHEAEMDALQEELDEVQKSMDSTFNQNRELTAQNKKLTVEVEQLAAESEKLTVDFETEMTELYSRSKELKQSLDSAERENHELTAQNGKITVEFQEAKRRLETEIVELQEKSQELQQSLDLKLKQNDELIAKNENLTVEAEVTARKLESNCAELETLRAKVKAMDSATADKLTVELKDAETKPEMNCVEHQQEVERLQNSMASLTELNQQWIAKLGSTKQQLQHASKQIDLLNEVVLKQQKELEENKIMKTKQEDVDSIKNDYESMKQGYEKKVQELNALLKAKDKCLEVAEKLQKAYEKRRQLQSDGVQLANFTMDDEDAVVNKTVKAPKRRRRRSSNNAPSTSGTSFSGSSNSQLHRQQRQYLHSNYPPIAYQNYGYQQQYPHYTGLFTHPQQSIIINNQQIHAQNQVINQHHHPTNQQQQQQYYYFPPQQVFQSSAPQFKNSPHSPHQQPSTPQ